MIRKILKLMTVSLVLMSCFVACTKKEKIEDIPKEPEEVSIKSIDEEAIKMTNDDKSPLESTKWKLVGIVDANTNELKVLEPIDSDGFASHFFDEFYTLLFESKNTFSGRTTTNGIGGTYEVNYETNSILFLDFGGTKLGELGDGNLWWSIFPKIKSFSLQENELKLYYNDNNNYLFFKAFKPYSYGKTIKIFIDEPATIQKKCFDHLGKAEGFYFVLETRYIELVWTGVVPIEDIPEQYRKVGMSVKISGNVTDCTVGNGCSEPHIKLSAINLFELKSIKSN